MRKMIDRANRRMPRALRTSLPVSACWGAGIVLLSPLVLAVGTGYAVTWMLLTAALLVLPVPVVYAYYASTQGRYDRYLRHQMQLLRKTPHYQFSLTQYREMMGHYAEYHNLKRGSAEFQYLWGEHHIGEAAYPRSVADRINHLLYEGVPDND
jgi:hypothetical protein